MGLPVNPETFRILHPSGFVCYPNDTGGSVAVTTQSVPGKIFAVRHPITYDLEPQDKFFGLQGYVDLTLKMGTVASGLVFAIYNTSSFSSIQVNTSSNKFVATLQDQAGNIVGQTDVTDVYDPGTPVRVTLIWDSKDAILDSDHIVMMVNGGEPAWTTDPFDAWTPFLPSRIVVGEANSDLGVGAFNGEILLAEVGIIARAPASPVFDILPPPIPIPPPGPGPLPWPRPRPWRRRGGGILPRL